MVVLRKLMVLAVAGALVLGALAGCAASKPESKPESKPAEEQVIKIGHEVALTGDSSMWGQSEKNALEMVIEEINKEGGVLGKQIKLISYDNRADATEGVNVARRLIHQDKVVAIIGPAQSGVAIAVSSVTEPDKVPFVATTATNPKVTVDNNVLKKYAFRACFIDPFQGTVAAQFAYTDLGARKAAILYDVGSDYSSWLGKYFVEAFTKLGGEIVANEAFRSGELDFRAMLGKIKPKNPDVLFIPTMQKEAALAMKQARDLKIKATFLGGDGWASPDLITLGGSAVEGSYFVNIASLEDPEIQDFIAEYRQRYKADPVMPNPIMAVDALYAIVDAIKRTQSTDPTKIAEALAQTKDLKVLSGLLTIDPNTHDPVNKPAVIQGVKEGKFVFVKKYVTK